MAQSGGRGSVYKFSKKLIQRAIMTNNSGKCLWWPLELSAATWARESSITADRGVATGAVGKRGGSSRKMPKMKIGGGPCGHVFGEGKGANTFRKFSLSALQRSKGNEIFRVRA